MRLADKPPNAPKPPAPQTKPDLQKLIRRARLGTIRLRAAAVAALGRTGDPRALPEVRAALNSWWTPIRLAAIDAVADLHDTVSIPTLARFCWRASGPLALRATWALGRFCHRDAVTVLVDLATSRARIPTVIREHADHVLRRLPSEVVPMLVEQLRRDAACDAAGPLLLELSEGAIDSLNAERDGQRGFSAHRAAALLSALGHGAPDWAPELIAVLGDPSIPMRAIAARGLLRIAHSTADPRLGAALEPLESCSMFVPADDRQLFEEARTAIRKATRHCSELPGLESRSSLPNESQEASDVVASGVPVPRSTERLIAGLGARTFRTRSASLEKVVALGRHAVPALVTALASGNWQLRRSAILALERIGAPETVPAVRACIRDPERGVRQAAIRAAGRHQDRAASITLHDALWNDTRDLQPTIIEALGRIGDPASSVHLCSLLRNHMPSDFLVPLLIWALGKTGTPESIPALSGYDLNAWTLPTYPVEQALTEIGARYPGALATALETAGPDGGRLAGALFRLGPIGFPELQSLSELTSSRPRIRARAVLASQGQCDPSWLPDLLDAIHEGPARVSLLAARGLEQLAERWPTRDLTAAIPVLRATLAERSRNPEPLQVAADSALQRVTRVIAKVNKLPVPIAGTLELERQLPRPAEASSVDGSLPVVDFKLGLPVNPGREETKYPA